MSILTQDNKKIPTDLLSRHYHIACGGALLVFLIHQIALVNDFYKSLSRKPQLSPRAQQANLFVAGAFSVSLTLQFLRIMTRSKSTDERNIGSFVTTLTINIIAAVSVFQTLSGEWGGMTEDALG